VLLRRSALIFGTTALRAQNAIGVNHPEIAVNRATIELAKGHASKP